MNDLKVKADQTFTDQGLAYPSTAIGVISEVHNLLGRDEINVIVRAWITQADIDSGMSPNKTFCVVLSGLGYPSEAALMAGLLASVYISEKRDADDEITQAEVLLGAVLEENS